MYDKKSRDFIGGIERNLRSVQKYFPGYTMRLYYQVPPNSSFFKDICNLACSHENFDLCNVENIPRIGKLPEHLWLNVLIYNKDSYKI